MRKSELMKARLWITSSLTLLAMTFALTSCGGKYFEQRTVIPEAAWDMNDHVTFDVPVYDTLSTYSFGMGLRHLENYRYSNLYIFLHITMPNGNTEHDTIQFILATNEGEWVGKSSGSMRDFSVVLNPQLRFPLKGNYHFDIEQAMREPVLKGISDIGLFVDKNP